MRIEYAKKIDHDKTEWHNWYAWHPVRLDSTGLWWLTQLERKGKHFDDSCGGFWEWQYRLPDNGDASR